MQQAAACKLKPPGGIFSPTKSWPGSFKTSLRCPSSWTVQFIV